MPEFQEYLVMYLPTESPNGTAASLLALLGGSAYGTVQAVDGSYPGRRDLTLEDLEQHFAGHITVAVSIVKTGRSRILAFDIDRHFRSRLRQIAQELRARNLDGATICTSGSDDDRGKIIVFFEKACSQRDLAALGYDIKVAASTDVSWGIAQGKDFGIIPSPGAQQSGSALLRIGGRNRHPGRNATKLDVFFTLDGEPATLSRPVPAKKLRPDPAVITKAPLGRWVARWLHEPWDLSAGSKYVFRRFVRLANEAQRVHGNRGIDVLRQWSDQIWQNSPELQKPSPTSGDVRSKRTFTRWVINSSENARRQLSADSGHYIDSPGLYNVHFSGSRGTVYRALIDWSQAKGISPDAIGISLRSLAAITGYARMTVDKAIRRLAHDGHVVIVDRGLPPVPNGSMILGLVGTGESPEAVLRRAATRGNVINRRRFREDLAAGKYKKTTPLAMAS